MERPYLLGPRGRQALLRHSLIPLYAPQKPGSAARPVPSGYLINTRGSKSTRHEMALVELHWLLEQVTSSVADPHQRGLCHFWAERMLTYSPKWPMFAKGKNRALNRPSNRHPDAILEWRGGNPEHDEGSSASPIGVGRFAVELETSSAQSSPKSAQDYARILLSYTELQYAGLLDYVLFLFEDPTAAKRFLNRYLPEIRARSLWGMHPELWFVASWPNWRALLRSTLKTGRRVALPLSYRRYHRELDNSRWLRWQKRDLWMTGGYSSLGSDPTQSRLWSSQDPREWTRCWVASTPEGADAAHRALLQGQRETLRDLEDSQSDRDWVHVSEFSLKGFRAGTYVRVEPDQTGDFREGRFPGILRVVVLKEIRDPWRGPTFHTVISGYVHQAQVHSSQEIQENVHRWRNRPDVSPSAVFPTGELVDPAYLDWKNRALEAETYVELDGEPIVVYQDISTFREALADPAALSAAVLRRDALKVLPGAYAARFERTMVPERRRSGSRRRLWRVLISHPAGVRILNPSRGDATVTLGQRIGLWWVPTEHLTSATDGQEPQQRYMLIDPDVPPRGGGWE